MTQKQHGLLFHLLDVLFNIVVIVAIVAGIRTFLVSPFQVEGNSMIDTLEDQQYIIINKFAYLAGKPARGDVVVFRPPNDPDKYYVKRVIGLPGETVTIRDGYVFIRGNESSTIQQLDENDYLNDRNEGKTYRHPPGSGDTGEEAYTIPSEKYFLLGDNRQGSLDSRSFASAGERHASPFVEEGDIKGRVWFVALPVTKIHALEPPDYSL